MGFHDDRRQLLDIFAQRSSRNEVLSAASGAFAQLANWEYRAVWGETFRGAPALANVEFLRGYAGCPVPEGVALAIDDALDGHARPAYRGRAWAARSAQTDGTTTS